MKKFRIKANDGVFMCHVSYSVQVKVLFFWVTLRTFSDEDLDYAKIQAEELLEKLTE